MKSVEDTLGKLQENLAKDLVHLEVNESVSKEQMAEITDTYSKVYDIITELNKVKTV